MPISRRQALVPARGRPMSGCASGPGAIAVAALVLCMLGLPGCRRKHVPVDALVEVPVEPCHRESGTAVWVGHLRSGASMREQDVEERFTLVQTSCGYRMDGRQAWGFGISDVHVLYDQELRPLRAWKRLTRPGSERPDGHADVRLFELRSDDVGIQKRGHEGVLERKILRPGGRVGVPVGQRVGAVIGPGRAGLTPWLRRAKLAPGQKSRELVLDYRPHIEKLEIVTLAREQDAYVPEYGKPLRVYTIYGREAVYADESDGVVGDLSGLRSAEVAPASSLPAMPDFGPADPWRAP